MNASSPKDDQNNSHPLEPDTSIPIQHDADKKSLDDHWGVLLVEFVHLLGLFLIQTRGAKSARATAQMFDQLIRHLNILSKLPENDGAMIIRQVFERDPIALLPPNYLAIFGNITLRGDTSLSDTRYFQGHMSHFGSALRQAFGCFAELGIQALYLQLPGQSDEYIEQLRLALNIVARFQPASEAATSITFRYFGRTLTVPLIRDKHGEADPNLTLMAGINGLSAANTREMIKQAEAYSQLTPPAQASTRSANWYNRIFCEPRLRRQLSRPLVEINNLPWTDPNSERNFEAVASKSTPNPFQETLQGPPTVDSSTAIKASNHGEATFDQETCKTSRPTIDRSFLLNHMNGCDQETLTAVDLFLSEDYSLLNPIQFGRRLSAISKVLDAIESKADDPTIIESVLVYLSAQLEWIPDSVLLSLHTQRKGLRIGSGKSTLLLGLVNPRLFDLIFLVKERVLTRLKVEAVQALTFGFKRSEAANLAVRFEISESDTHQIIALLQTCFNEQGRFKRQTFERIVDQMTPYKTAIFEMLWCLFKQTADRKGRLDFLNAIQLLIKRLDNTKHALQFLLSDLFQSPFEVKHMDRNAIVLANVLLRTHNQELLIDFDKTPDEVLEVQKGIERQAQQYVAWRLDFDQARIMTKLRTIADLLCETMACTSQAQGILFSPSFLAALEREVFIFLALVGGKTARILLGQALERYVVLIQNGMHSDHFSEPVKLDPQVFLNQMAIIIRGIGRIGRLKDVELLAQLEQTLNEFKKMQNDGFITKSISVLLKKVTLAKKAIQNG